MVPDLEPIREGLRGRRCRRALDPPNLVQLGPDGPELLNAAS